MLIRLLWSGGVRLLPREVFDGAVIAISGLFDANRYLADYPDVAAARVPPLVHYVRFGAREGRRPHPAFDAAFYLTAYPDVARAEANPFAHFLRFGARESRLPHPQAGMPASTAVQPPSGRPIMDVLQYRLDLGDGIPPPGRFTDRIGIFIHMFYADLASEFARLIAQFPCSFRVYVSTSDNLKKAAIEAAFAAEGVGDLVVKILPNQGRDMGPFLLGFADEIRSHELCLRLHSKKSTHGSGGFGSRWRRHLCSELISDRDRVSFVLDTFATHPDLGVLMAPHWPEIAGLINVGANWHAMDRLLAGIGVAVAPDQPIEYPSGSMFWFRSAALAPLLGLGLTWEDFADCAEADRDATIAHGLERTFLFFAARANLRWAFLPPRKADRIDQCARRHRVAGAHLEITSNCDLRCVYCAVSQPDYLGTDMSPGQIDKAVRALPSLGVSKIVVNGHGETTSVEGWDGHCRSLISSGAKLDIISNFAREFSDHEVDILSRFQGIAISIDTMDRALLAQLRRRVDVRTVIANMVRIRGAAIRRGEAGPQFGWSIVLSDRSIAGLTDLVAAGLSLGVRSFECCNMEKYPDLPEAVNAYPLPSLPAKERRRAMAEIERAQDLALRHGATLNLQAGLMDTLHALGNSADGDPPQRRYSQAPDAGETRLCLDPWSFILVKATGDVLPCCWHPPVGNIGVDSLKDILSAEPVRKLREGLLRGNLGPECQSCPARGKVSLTGLRRRVKDYLDDDEPVIHPGEAVVVYP